MRREQHELQLTLPKTPENFVDLRVGSKPETFAGETHEWKGWSFKMRLQWIVIDCKRNLQYDKGHCTKKIVGAHFTSSTAH